MFNAHWALLVISILVLVLVLIFTPGSRSSSTSDESKGMGIAGPWKIMLCFEDALPVWHGHWKYFSDETNPNFSLHTLNYDKQPIEVYDENTLFVLFNTAQRDFSGVPLSHVVGFSLEPNMFLGLNAGHLDFIRKYCSAYFLGDASSFGEPFRSSYCFLAGYRKDYITENCDKTSVMSLMLSYKREAPGHRYRRELADAILCSTLPVDIMGTGAEALRDQYPNDVRIKGAFVGSELYQHYEYTIAIENVCESDYISEKYTNAIAHNTIPLYLGCPRLKEYFGENAAIFLTGEVKRDMEIIGAICMNPRSNQIDLSNANRQLQSGGKAHFLTFLEKNVIAQL